MPEPLSRRDVLKRVGAAGAGLVLTPAAARGQASPIVVAGRPVEIVIASVSPSTVRVAMLPTDAAGPHGIPDDGLLVAAANGSALGVRREPFDALRAGNLTVRFSADPPALHIDSGSGNWVPSSSTSMNKSRVR